MIPGWWEQVSVFPGQGLQPIPRRSQEEQAQEMLGTQLLVSWLGTRAGEPGLQKRLWAPSPKVCDAGTLSLLQAPKFRGYMGETRRPQFYSPKGKAAQSQLPPLSYRPGSRGSDSSRDLPTGTHRDHPGLGAGE